MILSVKLRQRGTTGLEKALAENFDLIIIDIMLPGMDGFEVITELRKKKQTPVIFLSAKNTDIDKIRGLGLGADDYMTKPFSPNELVARVKAHISRYDTLTSKSGDVITVGKLMIDKDAHKVTVDGKRNIAYCKRIRFTFYFLRKIRTIPFQKRFYLIEYGVWTQ